MYVEPGLGLIFINTQFSKFEFMKQKLIKIKGVYKLHFQLQ